MPLTVVFDASPLITACKFGVDDTPVIDHLLGGCVVVIAPSVEEEVAVLGARYPDGVIAGRKIASGAIQVVPVGERRWAERLATYALGTGERDAIHLCNQVADVEALITDDYLAFVAATRLGIRVWMLPDLIVQLVERAQMSRALARDILQEVRSRYRLGVIEHRLIQLEEGSRSC